MKGNTKQPQGVNQRKNAITKMKVGDTKIQPSNPASVGIVPEFTPQRKVDLRDWQRAVDSATNNTSLNRVELYRIYDNTMLDLHLESVVGQRIKRVTNAKFKLIDPTGTEDANAINLFNKQWFSEFVTYVLESVFYGYSLIELFEQSTTPETVELNSGKKTYFPITSINLIERRNVRPELNRWIKNPTDGLELGIDYSKLPYGYYYIGVGKPKDLGLLKKIAPVALGKRYASGTWSEYNEKLGIPFRYVTMQGQDGKREKLLADILTNMGSAGWAVLHPGEEMKLLEAASSDLHKCFQELANFCDQQMSKAVLEQTGTTDEKAFAGSANVHQDVAKNVFDSDITFVTNVINDELIPRLVYLGYPIEGYKMERDASIEIPIQEQIKIDAELLKWYDLEPEYISDKYGVPLEMIKLKATPTVEPPLGK